MQRIGVPWSGVSGVQLIMCRSAARPLQHREVAVFSRISARRLVPRAALSARPLQHREVAASRRTGARVLVPWAALSARPLQHREVTATRRI